MTHPVRYRRDSNTKNASVIPGIRLESDTAKALCEEAVTRSPCEPKRAGGPVCGDVGQLVRYFIRTGLGHSAAEANRREESERLKTCGIAGLVLEVDICVRLTAMAHKLGITKAGAVRHFIRVGLGVPWDASLRREGYFAELASRHQSARLDGAARFKS